MFRKKLLLFVNSQAQIYPTNFGTICVTIIEFLYMVCTFITIFIPIIPNNICSRTTAHSYPTVDKKTWMKMVKETLVTLISIMMKSTIFS